MNKILIGTMAVTMCVSLAACGTSQNSAAVTSLGNQLDETANTVSGMQTANPADINMTKEMLTKIASIDNSDAIYDNVINTQQTLLNEEYYKMEILNRTAKIKTNLNKDIKLSKSQANAVKDLTNSLSKYTNSVAYTKNEMTSSVKSIASMKKNVEKNSDKINAKLNRLACNSNTRSAYYENLINTLEQLETCIKVKTETPTQETENKTEKEPSSQQTVENQNNNTTKNEDGAKQPIKNIDTFLPNPNVQPNQNNTENEIGNINQNCPSCTENNNQNMIYDGQNNGTYNKMQMPINNTINNTPYNGNVYNRYNRYNPTRNTDTYGPMARNIDTYGGMQEFGFNGMNNGLGYGAGGASNGMYGNGGIGMNNGMYGNGGIGMNNGMYGNGGIGMNNNRLYNSNNMNRMVAPVMEQSAMASTENTAEQRLESYEKEGENNTIEKDDESKTSCEKCVEPTNAITPIQNSGENYLVEVKNLEETKLENSAQNPVDLEQSTNSASTDKINAKIDEIKVSESKNIKTPKIRIVDVRKNATAKDLSEVDQPTIAHS